MKVFSIQNYQIDEIDKVIISKLQKGIEVTSRPYLDLATSLEITEEEICERLKKMHEVGFVRKIAVATNQYKLGYVYNAMTVWKVDEKYLDRVGEKFSQLGFVSHCYERPLVKDIWNYNLFAMIHARSEVDLEEKIQKMKAVSFDYCNEMDFLVSTEILKKTGIRLKDI